MNVKHTYSPVQSAHLTAEKLILEIRNRSKRSNIKKVSFVPPVVGSTGYGMFEVTYKTPVLTRPTGK